MSYIFQAHEVTKRFSAHVALDQVTVNVPTGSIFGLLGPNGAGKTTLIRIINQITGPDEGELFFNGEKLHPSHISSIGYLPEERGLYKKMKVGEQALYLAQLKGLPKHEALKKLKDWFDRFEILGWWNRKVEELSKGMQQKVQFITTVIHEPKLLIFDEPFSGFDPINVNLIKQEILTLKEHGSTIIFSTHNMASVEELCDHIALINRGHKILDGKVKEIKKDFKSNQYELTLSHPAGELGPLLKDGMIVMEEYKEDEDSIARIQLPDGKGPNELLSLLIPHVEIHALHEIIPSFNDIFIKTVTEAEKNHSVSTIEEKEVTHE